MVILGRAAVRGRNRNIGRRARVRMACQQQYAEPEREGRHQARRPVQCMAAGTDRAQDLLSSIRGLDLSQRASQKPSRPASKATATRMILCPAFSASSRHRCSSFSNALSSTASFFNGWRDARHDAGDKPALQAQLNHADQRAVRFQGDERSARVVQLLQGTLHRLISASMDVISSPPVP